MVFCHMSFEQADWLTDNDVVDAVVVHLVAEGWTIIDTAHTAEHGIDILARRSDQTLAVEPKGEGASKPGRKFTRDQKQAHMAVAVFAALRVASIGEHQAMIAFPEDPEHVRLLESVRPALSAAGVGILLVAPDRSVRRL